VNTNSGLKRNSEGRESRRWIWVLLCTLVIFSAIPVARRIQQFVYDTAGRDFFIYFVISVVGCGLAALLYLFIFELKIKKISQYMWLFVCAWLYIYFTMNLSEHPEEAIHLLEYGLLSYFVFRALSLRVRDRSIYITVILIVLFIGTIDEFIQWMTPGRYWGWKDVETDMLGGAILQLAIWKGIRPETISGSLRKISVKLLAAVLTPNLLLLGLCLSNTPDAVNRYTSVFKGLLWLRSEEPMAEFGHQYEDQEIGMFDSRLTLEQLHSIDLERGEYYGGLLSEEITPETTFDELKRSHNPYTDPFLFEFLIHVFRRDDSYKDISKTDERYKTLKLYNESYRENLILEKYFRNTLMHSGLTWSHDKLAELSKAALLWKNAYRSEVGDIITAFSLRTAWILITLSVLITLILGTEWTRRL
jgi:VanZ family protein